MRRTTAFSQGYPERGGRKRPVYICLCRVVTRTTIEAVIADGARTVEEVGQRCAAGTDCGKCQRTILRLLSLVKDDDNKEPTRGA